jgi:hypothetical protein
MVLAFFPSCSEDAGCSFVSIEDGGGVLEQLKRISILTQVADTNKNRFFFIAIPYFSFF